MKIPRSILKVATQSFEDFSPYNSFVRQVQNATLPAVATAEWFKSLPISSKETYVHQVHSKGCPFGNGVPDVAYASSGSSGKPTFWYRDEKTIEYGEKIHRYIFQYVYGIKPDEPTLVIVTFSMGLWVAGLFTADVFRKMRNKHFQITTITPGIDRKEGLAALQALRQNYKHVIIAGYPPFVLDFLREAKKESGSIHPSLFVLTAGDKFDEAWRSEVLGLAEKTEEQSAHVLSLYGSAEAGPMAFETPLSIQMHKAALHDQQLREQLFGAVVAPGAVYQFFPEQTFFEESSGELIITKDMPVPLVRYNMHDIGRVFEAHTFSRYEQVNGGYFWNKLPLVTVNGRTDVAVTLYALNIYPEHIAAGLLPMYCNGSYCASNEKRKGKYSQKLVIDVELKPGIDPSRQIHERILSSINGALIERSTEFRKLTAAIGVAALPDIRLHPQGSLSSTEYLGGKSLLQIAGKKPKMLISNS